MATTRTSDRTTRDPNYWAASLFSLGAAIAARPIVYAVYPHAPDWVSIVAGGASAGIVMGAALVLLTRNRRHGKPERQH